MKVNLRTSEDILISEGCKYKLEVFESYYELHWKIKESYLLMYRFDRDMDTGLPKISDKENTLEMCKNLYEGPGIIPIRDVYLKIAFKTNDSTLDFYSTKGQYDFRKFSKGKLLEHKQLDYRQFFELVKQFCNLDFEVCDVTKEKSL